MLIRMRPWIPPSTPSGWNGPMGPFVMPPPAGAGLQSGLRPSLRPAPAGNHTGHHSCRSTGQDNCRRRQSVPSDRSPRANHCSTISNRTAPKSAGRWSSIQPLAITAMVAGSKPRGTTTDPLMHHLPVDNRLKISSQCLDPA